MSTEKLAIAAVLAAGAYLGYLYAQSGHGLRNEGSSVSRASQHESSRDQGAVNLVPVSGQTPRGFVDLGVAVSDPYAVDAKTSLAAERWMSIRDADYKVTAEERLAQLMNAHQELSALEGDSLVKRRKMADVAAIAVATHLDFRGQATTQSIEPNEYQSKFSRDGSSYVFERGQFEVYDEASLLSHRVTLIPSRPGAEEENPGDASGVMGPRYRMKPPDPALSQALDRFVEDTVALLLQE